MERAEISITVLFSCEPSKQSEAVMEILQRVESVKDIPYVTEVFIEDVDVKKDIDG